MKILMIVPHGLNPQYLGCYGNESLSTPALDRLAAEGIVFDQHYADHPDPFCRCQFDFFSTPSCEPSRHGKYVTMARIATSDLEIGLLNRADWHRTEQVQIGLDWQASLRKLFEAVLKLTDELSGMASWLLRIDIGILLPRWRSPQSFKPNDFSQHNETSGPEQTGSEAVSQGQSEYCHLVERLDTGIQELRLQLDKAGLLEQLVIIVTSYRGQDLGEFHSFRKWRSGFLHQELVHLPLVLRMPHSAHALRRIAALTQPVDLAVTLQELLGLPAHDNDGANLLAAIQGGLQDRRQHVCSYLAGRGCQNRALRTVDWCLLESETDSADGLTAKPANRFLLFRRPEDRWEINDVYHLESNLAASLENTLRECRPATPIGGHLPLPLDRFSPSMKTPQGGLT